MKKQIIQLSMLFLILIIACNVNGQSEKTKRKPALGILVGGTLSNISNYDAANRFGFAAGVYAQQNLSEKLSLITSISYAQRGALSKDNLVSIKLDYLTFPFMLQYKMSDKVAISSGIAWDDLLIVNGKKVDTDVYRLSDWRVPVGLSYSISQKIKIGFAYSFGLTDITKNDTEKLRNNWGSLALVYMFKKRN